MTWSSTFTWIKVSLLNQTAAFTLKKNRSSFCFSGFNWLKQILSHDTSVWYNYTADYPLVTYLVLLLQKGNFSAMNSHNTIMINDLNQMCVHCNVALTATITARWCLPAQHSVRGVPAVRSDLLPDCPFAFYMRIMRCRNIQYMDIRAAVGACSVLVTSN